MKLTHEALREEYATLWTSMEIRASKAADIEETAKKIVSKKTRYSAIEEATGVPWYVVGIIHAMESGCNFAKHLHNGDPLTGRTVQVPAGRPKAPPADGKVYSWKESACDALLMKGLDKVGDWSIERICYELERYNGWGYRRYHSAVLSPYLWSGTNHYVRGKYVADGRWSATAMSGQSGAVALLKQCMALDSEVRPQLSDVPPVPVVEASDPVAEFPKAEPKPVVSTVKGSRTIFGALMGVLATVGATFKDSVSVVIDAAQQIEVLSPAMKVASALGITMERTMLVIGIAAIATVIFARLDDANKGHVK